MNILTLIGILTASALIALICYAVASGALLDLLTKVF